MLEAAPTVALPKVPFFDPATFSFLATLERSWRTIRAELDKVRAEEFVPWPELDIYEGEWKAFGFYAFGRRLDRACALCPETARLVAAIPGMLTAGFSVLKGGTHITPHVGYTDEVLRYHLGLAVPEPDQCGLRVDDETRRWVEGESLLFDDTFEHEAWNRGTKDRVVLLMDFARPGVTLTSAFPAPLLETAEMLARDGEAGDRGP